MAKVGHFAEGWQKQQKKSVSERMHERNQQSRSKDLQQSKVMKHLTNMAQKTSRPQSASAPKSSPLVKPGKDVPQTVQRNRGETQDQAARQQNLASKRFVKVRQDAQNLKSLQSKAPQSSRAATPKAVNQKGPTIQPDLKRAPQQPGSARLAQAATRTAQEQAARQNAAKTARYAAKPPKQGAKEARPTDRMPHVQPQAKDASQARQAAEASAKAGQPAPAKDGGSRAQFKKSGEGKKKAEKQQGSRSTKGTVGAGRSSDASGRLGSLMSGLGGGGQDHDAHERAHEIADLKRTAPPERLPETDPSFHVYSEFDTAKPGAEFGKGKAQLLAKVTKEKRLTEIAEFDQKLDKFIAEALSKRVIGPLKDEIKAADFLCSVNGGLIG